MSKEDDIDLGRLVRPVLSNLWLIGLLAGLFGFIGLIYVSTVESQYRSSISLYLKNEGAGTFDPLSVLAGGATTDTRWLESEVIVIRSNEIVGQLVDQRKMLEDPEFNGKLREPSQFQKATQAVKGAIKTAIKTVIRKITGKKSSGEVKEPNPDVERFSVIGNAQNRMTVSVIPKSFIVTISFRASSPEKAASIVTDLANIYIEDRLRVKYETTNQALEYLKGRLPDLKNDVEQAELQIAEFRSTAGVMSAETLMSTNALLAQSLEQQNRLNERYNKAQNLLDTFGTRVTTAEDAREVLNQTDYNGQTPEGSALLSTASRELVRQRAILADFGDRSERLGETIESLRARVKVQGEKLINLGQMEREAEASQLIYENFLAKLKEVSQQAAVQESDVRIIARAKPIFAAVSPRIKLVGALAALLGAAIGVAIALLKDFYLAPFRNADEVTKATGQQVLLSTPESGSRLKLGEHESTRRGKALMRAIRDLRSLVTINAVDGKSQVIMVTSTVPGEGKTTTAALLAEANALANRSTLLIDCDFWRQRLSKDMGAGDLGIIQVLMNDHPLEDVIGICDPLRDVHLLPAGAADEIASNMLVDRVFDQVIAKLRARYDSIIIDCPPMIAGSDARVISRSSDMVLYLVHARKTQRQAVKRHVADLASVAGEKVKLVVSHARGSGLGYGYGSYGYQYQYGDDKK